MHEAEAEAEAPEEGEGEYERTEKTTRRRSDWQHLHTGLIYERNMFLLTGKRSRARHKQQPR